MKNLQCPKCHSNDIVRIPGELSPPPALSGAKPASSLKAITTTRYCCANCGYTETWVDEPADLKALLKKFGF
jgi:predicted nucleic-acid-binding Zn-ribbon protein